MRKPRVSKLFRVTIRERSSGAVRDVNVAASSFGEAAARALRAEPAQELWRPYAVKVELVGKVW